MGDQIGKAVTGKLYYAPIEEFDKVLSSDLDKIRKTEIFASLSRINTFYMIANAGSGHIGSSFSSIDIMSWIHLNELRKNDQGLNKPKDIFFSSKGHDAPGLYSVMMGIRELDFNLIHKLRRIDGLPGHPDINTNNIFTNTGSLGMGISKAKGFIIANRLNNREGNVFVLTGDGELQEGQIWESLISAANGNFSELTVIVDHNKLQSDTEVSKVSDLGDLEAKFDSFGFEVFRCDGNDINDFQNTLIRSKKNNSKPTVIIADTIKGKGVSFMEHTSIDSDIEYYKYHSGAPSDLAYTNGVEELIKNANSLYESSGLGPLELEVLERPSAKDQQHVFQKLIPKYGELIISHANKNHNIVALDADLILDTGLIPFQKSMPNRFIECGIAEQDMVSQAGGMALNGLLPIVHSFSCFLSTRPNEQMYNNATEYTKIIYVASLAGVLPGGPGHSHQAVRDISTVGSIPNLTMIEPCCEDELELLTDWAVNENNKSTYLRLISLPFEVRFNYPTNHNLKKGQGIVLNEGSKICIFAYGPIMLNNAITASNTIKNELSIDIKVINMPWLNNIDNAWLENILEDIEICFSIDNHFIDGGFGSFLASAISASEKINARLIKIGLTDVPSCGTNDEILNDLNLDSSSIVKTIKSALNKEK